MPRGSFTLKLRMLGALLSIVALNAVFVAAVAWLYLVLVPTVVAGTYLLATGESAPALAEFLRLPLSPPALGLLTVGFLAGQVYYGYTRVLSDVREGLVGGDEYPALQSRVDRLAASADVAPPAVSVIDAPRPNSFTVGSGRGTTIVVTESLVELLADDELDAVLAHEIAHVRHRDVTLMTLTGLFVAVAERTLETARLLRRGLTDRESMSAGQRVALDWLLPVALVTYVFVVPVLVLFPPVARFASGELARQREYAADRAAVQLTGAPMALARALLVLHETGPAVAETDLRRARAELQELCVVPGPALETEWTDEETAGKTDDDGGDGTTGRSDDRPVATDADPETLLERSRGVATGPTHSHPPVHRRVERLVELAGEP